MKAAIYYIVKSKLIRRIKQNGEIEFLEFQEKFENENPIISRTQAFNHLQSYIDVLLESKGKNYISDKQAREELKSFIDPSLNININKDDVDFINSLSYGIGVFMIINKPIDLEIPFSLIDKEICIHAIGERYFGNYDPDSIMSNLVEELEYYNHFNYETNELKTEILFCDSNEWTEGYLGNGEWKDESYIEPNFRTILKTPYDWTGLEKPYWWGAPVEKVSKSIEQLISEGEGNQTEFKPSLLYNFKTKQASIGVKSIIAKAICSFLNSNGGFLFIGLNDQGIPQGLDYDFSLSNKPNSRDFFQNEFDQMIEHFLSFSNKTYINGQFKELNGKEIFLVTVEPSKNRPIFLNTIDEEKKKIKQFWVRGNAGNRQLTDIEEIANYCMDKWGGKNH